MGVWGHLCHRWVGLSLCHNDTKGVRWPGLAFPCPCTPSQLEGQVAALSQEVTRLRGQCKQSREKDSSQAKVWRFPPLGKRHSPLA